MLLLLQTQHVEQLEDHLRQGIEARFGNEPRVAMQLMRAVPDDVFYRPDSPYPRPQLVLEYIVAPGCPLDTYLPQLKALLVDAPCEDSSMVLVMRERAYIDCEPQASYYHYLMLKRPEFSNADYMDYYSNYHCRFGFHTPAIEGYSQNDIDTVASASLAAELGMTTREVTSISELKMPSVEAFLASKAMAELGEPAAADEERFVDRHNSISFSSEVVFRCGDSELVREAVFEQFLPGEAPAE